MNEILFEFIQIFLENWPIIYGLNQLSHSQSQIQIYEPNQLSQSHSYINVPIFGNSHKNVTHVCLHMCVSPTFKENTHS